MALDRLSRMNRVAFVIVVFMGAILVSLCFRSVREAFSGYDSSGNEYWGSGGPGYGYGWWPYWPFFARAEADCSLKGCKPGHTCRRDYMGTYRCVKLGVPLAQ